MMQSSCSLSSSKSVRARIHPTAIVDEASQIADNVEIGPYTIIGPHVKIGNGTKIANHVVIDGYTEIGNNCKIFSGACLGTAPQDKKYNGIRSYLIIGNDNMIREYVTMNVGSKDGSKTIVGDRNFIMIGVHVAHDCQLGNDITLVNSVGLSGHVTVEDQAVVGGLTGVHQFVRIGKLSMIGGVSKVNTDIPPFSICDGNPVKFYGLNSVGLKRAGYSSKDALQLKKALKILFASGLKFSTAIPRIKEEFNRNPDIDHLLEFVSKSERGIPRSVLKAGVKI